MEGTAWRRQPGVGGTTSGEPTKGEKEKEKRPTGQTKNELQVCKSQV